MADVPDQPVLGCIEDIVECDCEVHYTEPRRQMTAGTRDTVDEKAPQLTGQLGETVLG